MQDDFYLSPSFFYIPPLLRLISSSFIPYTPILLLLLLLPCLLPLSSLPTRFPPLKHFFLTKPALSIHNTAENCKTFPQFSMEPTFLPSHCTYLFVHLPLAPCWPPQRRQVDASREDSSIMIRMCGSRSRVVSVCATLSRFCVMR